MQIVKRNSCPMSGYTRSAGAFLLSEALLPHMTPGKSSIIHMSSIRARQSEPHTEVHAAANPGIGKQCCCKAVCLALVPNRLHCMQAYAAAKAGLVGLTHAQAVTLANKVRVNAVLPGWIYTESNRDDLTKKDHEWHPSGKQLWSMCTLYWASLKV